MRTEFKKFNSCGIMGIKCNCCRPNGCYSKKAARIVMNRRFRRRINREIMEQIAEAESAD